MMHLVLYTCLLLVCVNSAAGKKNVTSGGYLFGVERALYDYLLDGYQTGSRPVMRANQSIRVNISVGFNQILKLDEKGQVLTIIASVDQAWQDDYLTWKPADFEGIESTCFPFDTVWRPDIVLYNRVGDLNTVPYMESHVCVDYWGQVRWFPLAKLRTSCQLDISFFPFDYQTCSLRIGSWTYTLNQVDVQDDGRTGVDSNDFIDSGEFEFMGSSSCKRSAMPGVSSSHQPLESSSQIALLCCQSQVRSLFSIVEKSWNPSLTSQESARVWLIYINESKGSQVERSESMYNCCPHPFSTLNIKILLKRRSMFTIFTISTPCGLLSLMTVLAFVLPPANSAKVDIQLSVMLSLAVFMLLIGEKLPPTSHNVPLIGLHLVMLMTITAFSLVCSVIVLRIVDMSHIGLPPALKKKAVRLAKLLRVETPDHLTNKTDHYMSTHEGATFRNNLEMTDNDLNQSQSNKGQPPSPNRLDVKHGVKPPNNSVQNADLLLVIKDHLYDIVKHIDQGQKCESFKSEWIFLAALIDRILLISLLIIDVVATLVIYTICPLVQHTVAM